MRSMVEGPRRLRENPSTALRAVPLPAIAGRIYRRHMMLCDNGVQTPAFTPACRSAAPVQELQV